MLNVKAVAEAAASDEVAPPIAVCVSCGSTQCAGCLPQAALVQSSLAWEDARERWAVRLWRTALASSIEPQRFFAELPSGGIASALGFAVWAEVLALGSLALLGVLGLQLAAPELLQQLLASRTARAALALFWAAAVLSMLGLHAIWGASLELGAHRAGWRHGLRFGMYACGWDLLTSPVGLLVTLFSRGPLRAWSPLLAAARAPLPAQRAFLSRALAADAVAQIRARKLAVLAVSVALLALCAALGAVLFALARLFGY
jgi:hypothetical protein